MADTDSSISSHDEEGDAIMRPIPGRICKYKVTLKVSFVYTYVREYNNDDDGEYNQDAGSEGGGSEGYGAEDYIADGTPEKCDDDACSCSGDEYPLEPADVDTFMKASYCEKARYHWFAASVMSEIDRHSTNRPKEVPQIENVAYEDGGKITFIYNFGVKANKKPMKPSRMDYIFSEADFVQLLYEGLPGNEAIVPTKHKYAYSTMTNFETKFAVSELGRISCRGDDGIVIELLR
jgi:hypothetical protein